MQTPILPAACDEHKTPNLGTSFVLSVIADMTPADQKKTILEARSPDIGLISDEQAEILIRELGLASA